MAVPQYAPPNRTGGGHDPTAVMGRRTVAWVLDLLIYLGLGLALFAALAEYVEIPAGVDSLDACDVLQLQDSDAASGCIELGDRAYLTSESDNAVQAAAALGYFVVFVLLQGAGASPGKFLTGLRVVGPDGRIAGVGKSFVRTIMWIIDAAPWCLPLVGFITGLTTSGHRRVGDMVANTYVIRSSDVGSPVRSDAAAPPPSQPAWGAPPPSAPPWSPTPTPADRPPPGAPSSTEPPSNDVDALVPEISGVPDDRPAPPPPLADRPPTWEPPSFDDISSTQPVPEEPPDQAPPVEEAREAADIDAPEVPPDPSWWSGPEATPDVAGSEVPEDPGTPDWADTSDMQDRTDVYDPGDEWAPPTTPTSDIASSRDQGSTAGPAPFTAPGADPVHDAPAAPEEPPLPPPQWDASRNTYIQWDPRVQHWLYWDDVANQWRQLEG